MRLSLGFSPCPNDTFIFDAMVNGKIDTEGLIFNYVLEDVETLNNWAASEKLDITKLSYNAFLHLTDYYGLLHSGSALGKGVGPLLVAKNELSLDDLSSYKIAIPGVRTTANLLFTLAFPSVVTKHEVLFSNIEASVLNGKYDAGLVIHESRFTYAARGLKKLMDMGDWWESTTKAPIPLGGIAIRRTLDDGISYKVDRIIKRSLEYAWARYPLLPDFVVNNAQEMSEDVMRSHIELYVNDYTYDLGSDGQRAVETLFGEAKKAGLIDAATVTSTFR